MNVRMATYRGEIKPDERQCVCAGRRPCVCDRKRPKVLRRFVTRGGELVEVEAVVRETR